MMMVMAPAFMRGGGSGRERAENQRQADGATDQKPLH